MENKLMIIGIDSLDPYLITKFLDSLPNFKKLIDESQTFKMKSVFPPDTIPAWISIYTGLNPAEHGIIHTFDIFESDWKNIANLNIEAFKGRTFWDIASSNGRKTCILFPQSAFPPWDVNGMMVSRPLYPTEELIQKGIIIENGGVLARPMSICNKYQMSHLGTLSGNHPGFKKLGNYAEIAKKRVLDQADLGLKISRDNKWDLFFMYFSELDIIQHFFWRYYDENDPTHIVNNPYKNVIKEFYELLDDIVGKFLDEHQDTIKIVMSDHGHKMRPTKTVNINEILRRKGYLKLKMRTNITENVAEKIKKKILDYTYEHDLTYWLVKIGKMKIFSGTSKGLYTSSFIIDTKNSLAHLSYFTGAKSYSEGGIHVNNVAIEEREKFLDLLINELKDIQDPNNKKKVFEWIKRREDVYNGKNIHLYPDIVFRLHDEYGTFWSINTSIIGTAYEHNLSSGGHREDAVFLISNYNRTLVKKDFSLMDVAPTILNCIGLDWRKFDYEGINVFDERVVEY